MRTPKTKMVQIVGISKKDAFYNDRKDYIGLEGNFVRDIYQFNPFYACGTFYNKKVVNGKVSFFAVRYKKL